MAIKAKQLNPSGILQRDSAPSLSADLDVGTSAITTTETNGNVKLEPSGDGVIEIKGVNGKDGTLQLNCSANSHGVKIKSPPHSASASYTLTLPENDGSSNQVLKTDGSGNLSWTDQSSGGSAAPLRNLISNSGPYTVSSTLANGSVVYITTTGSNLNIIYLPKAGDVSAGTYYTICRTYDGTQGASIYPASGSSDTINGQTTTIYLAATDSFTMMSDGSSNWIKLGYGIQ